MMKKIIGALAILLLVLVVGNPSQEQHLWKLATTTGLPAMEDSGMPGTPQPAVKTSALSYHSYLLFSTTTHRQSGRVYTLGLLWMVAQL